MLAVSVCKSFKIQNYSTQTVPKYKLEQIRRYFGTTILPHSMFPNHTLINISWYTYHQDYVVQADWENSPPASIFVMPFPEMLFSYLFHKSANKDIFLYQFSPFFFHCFIYTYMLFPMNEIEILCICLHLSLIFTKNKFQTVILLLANILPCELKHNIDRPCIPDR